MLVANVSELRKNLKKYIDAVADKNDTLVVTGSGKTVIMISLDDYNKMDETDYLLSSATNKKRLDSAVKSFKAGKGTQRKLAIV